MPSYRKITKGFEKDYQKIVDARKFKGMPNTNVNGSVTEGFKARSLADEAKDDVAKLFKQLGKKNRR